MARVAAIILAAGGSSRFGKPKQLVQFDHQSLVRRIVNEARDAHCWPAVVVTGNARDEVERELAGTAATIVHNTNWKRGIGSSIRTGVRYLIDIAPEIDAVVLLVCDQPSVDANIIRQLIALRKKTQKPIVASGYAKTLGVPALFDRGCFEELVALDGDSGAKTIILSNKERVAELPFPDGAVDVDTEVDLRNAANRTTT